MNNHNSHIHEQTHYWLDRDILNINFHGQSIKIIHVKLNHRLHSINQIYKGNELIPFPDNKIYTVILIFVANWHKMRKICWEPPMHAEKKIQEIPDNQKQELPMVAMLGFSNLDQPSIGAFYQISINLAKWF